MLMMVMVVVMVTAARGVGDARKQNCIAWYFGEERNNELNWVMSTSTHKLSLLSHMAIIEDPKSALVMAERPSYGISTNKNLRIR